jgi:hypothetical protein
MNRAHVVLAATLSLPSGILAGGVQQPAHHEVDATSANAETPYAGQESRTVKSLSEDDARALLSGAGMGLAKAAELNHYPGPRHAIDLASELGLSEEQVAGARLAFDTMKAEATRLGREIVAKEEALDRLFASGTATDDSVSAATHELGALQGRLRAAHLRAHLRMREIMTKAQIVRYDAIRGYGR